MAKPPHVDIGNAEYEQASQTAHRLNVPVGRYAVLSALRYIRIMQMSHSPESAWRGVSLPA